MIYKIQISVKQRIGLAAVVFLGLIIIFVSISRASHLGDRSLNDAVLWAIWNHIEGTVGKYMIVPSWRSLH